MAVSQDPDAGYTTLVAVFEDAVVGCSSSDSAALLCLNEAAHALTENQRKNPPVVSEAADFVSFTGELARPWVLLVISDGVWKYSGWDTPVQTCRTESGKRLIDTLQATVSRGSGGLFPDDFSVCLFEPDLRR